MAARSASEAPASAADELMRRVPTTIVSHTNLIVIIIACVSDNNRSLLARSGVGIPAFPLLYNNKIRRARFNASISAIPCWALLADHDCRKELLAGFSAARGPQLVDPRAASRVPYLDAPSVARGEQTPCSQTEEASTLGLIPPASCQ